MQNDDTNSTPSVKMEKPSNSYAEEDFIEYKYNKREGFFFHKKKQNKKIILVDGDLGNTFYI